MKIKKIPYLGHYLMTGLLVLGLAWVNGTTAGCGGGGGGGSAPAGKATITGNSTWTPNAPTNLLDPVNGPVALGNDLIAIATVSIKGSAELSAPQNPSNPPPISIDGRSLWVATLKINNDDPDPAKAHYDLVVSVSDTSSGASLGAFAFPTTLAPKMVCAVPPNPCGPNGCPPPPVP